MDDNIATFLAFTATEDTSVAKQFLELSGNNVEYAVQLFMESGPASHLSNDADLAQRLQQEAYQDTNVREADSNVHRHETLQDSFGSYHPDPLASINAIFGRGRTGVFNQRFEELQDDDDNIDDDNIDDDEEDYEVDYDDEPNENLEDIEELGSGNRSNPIVIEVALDSENELNNFPDRFSQETRQNAFNNNYTPRLSHRARRRENHLNELSLTQRRLAELFKPPFDIMCRISLDDAKVKGRREQKWILVNIQDNSEFQCQVLNRDFWSNSEVKSVISQNFVFLQYQVDSQWGEMFSNFYQVDGYPYICILDPMTGERVRQWPSGIVPDASDWISDIELFLEKFSLRTGAQNPIVEHEVRFDPDAMTEEQQLEYALQQSIAASKDDKVPEEELGNDKEDQFSRIVALDHEEPAGSSVTRIQVRFPTGKRLIHKFDHENDKVIRIYEWLKFVFLQNDDSIYGLSSEDNFQISCAGNSNVLIECLDKSISEAGLRNASLLVEKI